MHGDGDGLWLRVVSEERRSWIFRYKHREMGLGAYPAVSLAEAREKAEAARKLLANNIDPLEHRREEKAAKEIAKARATTFAEACDAYIASNEAAWSNLKYRHQCRAALDYACHRGLEVQPITLAWTGSGVPFPGCGENVLNSTPWLVPETLNGAPAGTLTRRFRTSRSP